MLFEASIVLLPSHIWNSFVKVLKTFTKLWKLTKDLTAIQWAFIQEKWLNLSKNSKLCGILTCPTLIPTLSSVITLKNTHWHSQDWREQNRVRPLSKLYPKELSIFDLSGGFLKYSTQKPCLYLTSELCSVKKLCVYVCVRCLSKTFIGKCFNVTIPEAMDNSWGKQ